MNSYKQPIKFVPIAIGLFWLLLIGYQLIRSMFIDAYTLPSSRIDILGYWFGFLISFFLGLRMIHQRQMMLVPICLVFVLIFYVIFIAITTAPSKSPLSMLISRYGIMMWFVLGVGFTAVLDILKNADSTSRKNKVRLLTLVTLGILSIYALTFSQEVISMPASTLSYQSVASNAIIFLLIFTCILITIWGIAPPIPLSIAFLALSIMLVIPTAILQSKIIVAFFMGLSILFLGQIYINSKLIVKSLVILSPLIGLYYFSQTELYENILIAAQLLLFESGELSSLVSRLSILETFIDQFAVAPLFGHFEAERIVGLEVGYYPHSLPLSLMTHAGLIGTALTTIILFLLFRARNLFSLSITPTEKYLALLMLMIIGLATISSFFTWAPFWFMLGILCRKPDLHKYE